MSGVNATTVSLAALAEPLFDSINLLPIPTAPLVFDRSLEAFGMNLLALAIRMPHVMRIAESLSYIDSSHIQRKVGVDLNVATIPASVRASMSLAMTRPGMLSDGLWLPLDREPRSTLSPVIIKEESGAIVPRLTGIEASRAMAAGLVRLFRILFEGHPDRYPSRIVSAQPSSVEFVANSWVRSRWLCEMAIMHLVESGPDALPRSQIDDQVDGRVDENARTTRRLARGVIQEVIPLAFHEMLNIVATHHFLVAHIPKGRPLIHLEYEAPALPALPPRRATRRGFLRKVWEKVYSTILSNADFAVEYETKVPRGVDSYHLNFEVSPDLLIRRFTLSSNIEESIVRRLREDIGAVVRALSSPGDASRRAVTLEVELQSIASRLAEIGRRRSADMNEHLGYLNNRYDQLWPVRPRIRTIRGFGPHHIDVDQPFKYLAEVEQEFVPRLARFGEAYERGMFKNMVEHVATSDLEIVSTLLDLSEVSYDVYSDNDPRENAAHSQWRRRDFGRDRAMSGPVSLRMIATLSDDRPSLGAKVARLLMALVALVEAMRVFQYGLPFASVGSPDYLPSWIHGESAPEFNVDAGVAILLIIPGLLLTTMEFPDRQTVLGFIRRGPRFLAYAGVLATYTLALVLASRGAENQRGWFDGTVVTLLVLLSSTLIDRVVQAIRRRARVPRLIDVPRWLRMSLNSIGITFRGAEAPKRFASVGDE